jgi:replicative DNA helicase
MSLALGAFFPLKTILDFLISPRNLSDNISPQEVDTNIHRDILQNIDAERAVLGGILVEPDAMERVSEMLGGDGSDFYHDAHRKIFQTMVALSKQNTPIDLITLPDALKDNGIIDSVGGIPYIVDLVEAVPVSFPKDVRKTPPRIANYVFNTAKIVREKAMVKKFNAFATEVYPA